MMKKMMIRIMISGIMYDNPYTLWANVVIIIIRYDHH